MAPAWGLPRGLSEQVPASFPQAASGPGLARGSVGGKGPLQLLASGRPGIMRRLPHMWPQGEKWVEREVRGACPKLPCSLIFPHLEGGSLHQSLRNLSPPGEHKCTRKVILECLLQLRRGNG